MTTGERMKIRRKDIGLSAEKLAETLGVSPATIYRYENGEIEKAHSQFRIALKVIDAFKEDFVESKFFKTTVYTYANEQRKEIEALLAE